MTKEDALKEEVANLVAEIGVASGTEPSAAVAKAITQAFVLGVSVGYHTVLATEVLYLAKEHGIVNDVEGKVAAEFERNVAVLETRND